ncbi:Transposon TX1 uncharacterized 149 kDa [Paramuricea clavata]|uniref:Transposon TX1 uncharacterized 149 kDa n=1 Tax=Paramuricea clavata TaxID=317549 RepID=A0A6S7GPS6_PARCT|nr:Transposon TX1 uncharacterized 149 kDa [Paramuricea clavata]
MDALPPFYRSVMTAWFALERKFVDNEYNICGPRQSVVTLEKLSASFVYDTLYHQYRKQHRCVEKFANWDLPVDWSNVWLSLLLWRFIRPVRDTSWLIAHGILPTADRLLRFGMQVDPFCHCGRTESLIHLFIECPFAIQLIDWYFSVYKRFRPQSQRPTKCDLLVGYGKKVVHSYEAYGVSEHCVTNPYGSFWNMPADRNSRKRNLIVSFTDKYGTYSNQKLLVLKAIDQIAAKTNFYSVREDTCNLLHKLAEELNEEGVWKYVTSLNVLKEYDDLVITADNALTYINEEYTFQSHYMHKKQKVRLVITLKSMEIANGLTCNKSCDNQGSCRTQPYSSAQYCQCKPYFQGDKCEEHTEAQLAKTMDSLLEKTLNLPKLSDIAYDIKDMREYVGINFGEVRSAIGELEAVFKKAIDSITRMLTDQFQWSNLITLYNEEIREIEYYSNRFQQLPKLHPNTRVMEGKQLATAVLAENGVKKWLFEVNFLFIGRTGSPLVKHEPLMLVFMNRYKSLACTPAYKAAVDNTWRQLVLLQQMGFVVWVQALQIMGRPTEQVAQLYDAQTNTQVSTLNQKTCEYSIANSDNVQCTGGRYLYPAMKIMNQCKANYYITGTKETTCVKKESADAAHAAATQLALMVRNVPIYPDSAVASRIFMATSVRIEIVYGDIGLTTLPVTRVVTMGVPRRELGHTK